MVPQRTVEELVHPGAHGRWEVDARGVGSCHWKYEDGKARRELLVEANHLSVDPGEDAGKTGRERLEQAYRGRFDTSPISALDRPAYYERSATGANIHFSVENLLVTVHYTSATKYSISTSTFEKYPPKGLVRKKAVEVSREVINSFEQLER